MPIAVSTVVQRPADPVDWLTSILWPEATAAADGGAWVGRPGRPVWAWPSVEAPTILVPADSVRAARRAVARAHDGLSATQRLRHLGAEALLASGPVASWALRRRRIELPRPPEPDLLDALGARLGLDDLRVAIGLSHPKSNRKPVLQLLDARGTCHGWAKVAWSDHTEALVANEAAWLRRSVRWPVLTPRVIDELELAGRRVLILDDVTTPRLPRRPRRRPPGPEVFRSVAGAGTVVTAPVHATPWWRSVEAVLDHATDAERDAVEREQSAVGHRVVEIGAWHGDLTPWNLMTTHAGVQLIDWELAADGVPFGLDLCHFHTQVAAELLGLGADAALTHSARLSPHGLARIGVTAADRDIVWRCYLLELVRRTLALRAAGLPTADVRFGAAAAHRLRRPATRTDPTPQPAIGERRVGWAS